MSKGTDVCRRIAEIFPDAGECGRTLEVQPTEDDQRWVVEMASSDSTATVEIANDAVVDCMEEGRCAAVAVEVLGVLAERDLEAERRGGE
jgi:hypothetical protein